MDAGAVVEHVSQALWMMFVLSGPAMVVILLVGLVIGILQAATSISDSSLSFLPKLVLTVLTMLLAAPLIVSLFVDYLRQVLQVIAELS